MNTTLIFRGGLGNQMFQYALLLALRKNGFDVIMDISYYNFVKMHNGFELSNVFGITDSTINKKGLHLYWLRMLDKTKPRLIYAADNQLFNKNILDNPPKWLSGYWQDERYFSNATEEARKSFTFQNIDSKNMDIAEKMKNSNSVSLHIRRGDYTTCGMSIVGENYYRKAVEQILSKVDDPLFFIFSDDKEAASRMTKEMGIRCEVISHNTGKASYKDMYLMSQCKHNIIANSSFSWWGAWLNPSPLKIVIAPKKWNNNPIEMPQASGWTLL